jgi:hypothetical protein
MSKHHMFVLLLACSTAAGAEKLSDDDQRRAAEEDRRRAAELINEARRRVGDQPTPLPEAKPHRDSMKMYVTIGSEERIDIAYAALVEPIRSAQRSGAPLEYLEPREDFIEHGAGSLALALGLKVNRWLDVEISRHGIGSYYDVSSVTRVIDPEIPIPDQEATAVQQTEFTESSWTVTALPRWAPIKHFAIYGRFGVGYASGSLDSILSTGKLIKHADLCTIDPVSRRESCEKGQAIFRYGREWSRVTQKGDGFFPVLGVGVELTRYIRLEYQRRFAVPIGNERKDLNSEQYVSVRFFGEWDLK